ncbi:MAG TPA: hypothetical protein VMZ03_07265 [Chitinophagaceae bacterium]|nr:hypothetical protein [Chitinophagaceae bacterium]
MKLLHKISAGISIVSTLLIMQSCTKQNPKLVASQQTDFSNSSIVQVYMAAVGTISANVFVDAAQLTGATIASGGVFPPGAGAVGANIQSGVRAFLVTTPTPLSFAENMQPSGAHTIFIYDTSNAPKQKTVPTLLEVPADTTARLRFANFVYSPFAIPAVDVFSKRRNAVIFSNVQITDVTGFIPYASGLTDTLYIRPTGTTTNLQNWVPPVAPATVGAFADIRLITTPVAKRSYTVVFRGGWRASVSTNSTVRTLSIFTNY